MFILLIDLQTDLIHYSFISQFSDLFIHSVFPSVTVKTGDRKASSSQKHCEKLYCFFINLCKILSFPSSLFHALSILMLIIFFLWRIHFLASQGTVSTFVYYIRSITISIMVCILLLWSLFKKDDGNCEICNS